MTRKLVIPAVAAFFVVTWVAAARSQTQGPTSLGFKKRFVIEVRNPGPVALESYPIVLSVETIRAFAPDFNSFNYAIFDEAGGGYQLVPSQADDLDRDRAHEEIVFIRTLPASSTTRLACYYSAKGAFQLMMSTPKAGARLLGGGPAGILAGWESNLAGFKFVDGRVEAYGKLYPGLVLSKAAKDDAKLQEWGLDILAGGGSLGLGGLSAWEGGTAVPLAGAGAGGGFTVQRTVLASGPLRALVKVEYSSPLPGARGSGTVVLFSAFADNIFCRQDIHPGPGAGRRGEARPGARRGPAAALRRAAGAAAGGPRPRARRRRLPVGAAGRADRARRGRARALG